MPEILFKIEVFDIQIFIYMDREGYNEKRSRLRIYDRRTELRPSLLSLWIVLTPLFCYYLTSFHEEEV